MLIDCSTWCVAILNVVGWPIIQVGLGWTFTRMPARWFEPPRPMRWESEGRIYERFLRVRRWKDRLPDGAQWFEGGFAKARLDSTAPEYLRRFLLETWRGELCHWSALAFAPVFALWNPPWAVAVMTFCGLLLNLPCIVVLRFNRARFYALVGRRVTRAS